MSGTKVTTERRSVQHLLSRVAATSREKGVGAALDVLWRGLPYGASLACDEYIVVEKQPPSGGSGESAAEAPPADSYAAAAMRGVENTPERKQMYEGQAGLEDPAHYSRTWAKVLPQPGPAWMAEKPTPPPNFKEYFTGGLCPGRVMIRMGWGYCRGGDRLELECSGVILDGRNHLAPLVIFPPAPVDSTRLTKKARKKVDEYLKSAGDDGSSDTGPADGYRLTKIADGTVVALYPWTHPDKGKIWCIATRRGIDVSPFRWIGERTFAEVIAERLEAGGVEAGLIYGRVGEHDVRLDLPESAETPTDSTESAGDSPPCHIIAFRDSEFHPVTADPPGIWRLGCEGLRYAGPYFDALPELETIEPHTIGLPRAEITPLAKSLTGSLQEAVRAVAEGSSDGTEGSSATGRFYTPQLQYGFLIRPADPNIPAVIVGSELLDAARRLIYQRPRTAEEQEEVDWTNRLAFAAVRAYLTPGDRALMSRLCPSLAEKHFDQYEIVSNAVTEAALAQIAGTPVGEERPQLDLGGYETDDGSVASESVASSAISSAASTASAGLIAEAIVPGLFEADPGLASAAASGEISEAYAYLIRDKIAETISENPGLAVPFMVASEEILAAAAEDTGLDGTDSE